MAKKDTENFEVPGGKIDGGPLDDIVQLLAQGMAEAVANIRAVEGLSAKEFTKRALDVLGKYEKTINKDSTLNQNAPNPKKALLKIRNILRKHQKDVKEAGELSPLKLLGTAIGSGIKKRVADKKSGIKQGVANKIKSIPGMESTDKIARMMGLTPLSEKLTPKGFDQRLERERDDDLSAAEGGLGNVENILEEIAKTLDATKKQDKETAVAEAKERAEFQSDAAERERRPRLRDEKTGRFIKAPSSPVPVGPVGEEDKGPGFLGRLIAGVTGVAGTTLGATAGTAMGSVAAKAGGGALGLMGRVAGGGLGMALRAGTGILGMLGLGGLGTGTAAAGTAAAGTAAAGTAAAGGGIMSGIVASLSASLTALGTVITTVVAPLVAVAALAYILYETWKALDFSAILKPLAKWFNILKDIVMTVGEVIYKILIVGFKVIWEGLKGTLWALWEVVKGAVWALKKLGQALAFVLQPVVDLLALALTPIVDAFGWLWEKGLKPVIEWFGFLLDRLINADSIFLELGSILKEGFLSLIRLVWNAIADKLSWVPGIDKMEAPETPPGAKDDKTPIPDEPKEEEKKSGSWWPFGGSDEEEQDVGTGDYAGLRIKGSSGATQIGGGGQATEGGPVQPGVIDFASMIQGNVQGFTRFTGFNDNFHQASNVSKHKEGLAMDFTVEGGAREAPKAAATVRKLAADAGVPSGGMDVIDEYNHPSSRATAGHIHAEFNTKDAALAAGGLASSPMYVPNVQPGGGGRAGGAGAPRRTLGPPPPSRNAPQVAAGTAQVATAGAAAPTLVNIGGPSATSSPSTTTMMPIPIPIRPRTEDEVLRAMYSVNQV